MGLGESAKRTAKRTAKLGVKRLAERVGVDGPPVDAAAAPATPGAPVPETGRSAPPDPEAAGAAPPEERAPGALRELRGDAPQGVLADLGTDELVRELVGRSDSASPGMAVRMDAFGVMMPAHPGVQIEIPSPDAPVGGLAPTLALQLSHRAELSFDNRFGRSYFQWAFATFPGDTIEGKVCVDLGCGSQNPFALSMIYLLLGARRAVAVDIDPPQDEEFAAWGVARIAAMMAADPQLLVERWPVTRTEVAGRLEGFDVARLWEGHLDGLDRERISHARTRAEVLPMADAEVDYVFSTSFLEHLDDLDAVVAELARVIRPGGWTWHLLDGIDHRTYSDPTLPALGFLSEPADLPLVHGCNRLRPLQVVEVFERHGFESVTVYPYLYMPVDEAEQAGFVEPWRSMAPEVLALRSAVMSFRRT